jgi:phosphoribosylanthranilate isomerase
VATKVKFCGITTVDDAHAAVSLDAWAIGMIFWAPSPRAVDPGVAVEIAAACKRKAEIAGVFVNAPLDEITAAADAVGLTMIQLHGDEGPVFCREVARRTGCKVIKAVRVHDRADIQAVRAFKTDFHLLDSYVPGKPGGTGETFAWELVRGHRTKVPVILSGGLTPDNVAEAISVAQPFAVDVASGVEASPGIKDHAKLRAFAEAVQPARSAAPAGTPS